MEGRLLRGINSSEYEVGSFGENGDRVPYVGRSMTTTVEMFRFGAGLRLRLGCMVGTFGDPGLVNVHHGRGKRDWNIGFGHGMYSW